MSKRASGKFKRNPRDFYSTPFEAVVPLFPHLSPRNYFDEPCAGSGALVHHLKSAGFTCSRASDIEPAAPRILKVDALGLYSCSGKIFITNPPWGRPLLHKIIEHLSNLSGTWLLIDADWMHTRQSAPFMDRCAKIVSVGRISWMGNGVSGFDNAVWMYFDKDNAAETAFVGRAA